ncbi:MAG: CsbD family protein [Pseudomonas fluorescens]|nr:MAG: CsbD family protein [Pseudomonas fluorescens]
MNKDILQGKWTQYKGMALKSWGKLTNDDVDVMEGRAEELVGRLQERYGWAREEAERRVTEQVAEWDKQAKTRH